MSDIDKKLKHAVFFGGGMKNTESDEYRESILIGNLLADKGYLVKNGGYYGLMEAVSKGVSEKDGIVHGFTCKTFKSTKGNEYLSDTIVSDNIYSRLNLLCNDNDIIIAQKGGIGTLTEICLSIDECRKMNNPPKIYLIGNEWFNIFKSINLILSESEQKLITYCKDYEELKTLI